MAELFGLDIAGIIGQAFDGQLASVELEREVEGARDPNNLTGGKAKVPTNAPAGMQGFWQDFSNQFTRPPGIELELNDRKAVIIGDSIPDGWVPKRNDALTIDGLTLYVWSPISVDPANAVYEFLCRDRKAEADA